MLDNERPANQTLQAGTKTTDTNRQTKPENAPTPRCGSVCVCCRVLDSCIEVFDHYCVWVHNSVGAGNHREFVALALFQWIMNVPTHTREHRHAHFALPLPCGVLCCAGVAHVVVWCGCEPPAAHPGDRVELVELRTHRTQPPCTTSGGCAHTHRQTDRQTVDTESVCGLSFCLPVCWLS